MLIIITIKVLVIFPDRSYYQLCESFTDDEITSIAVDSLHSVYATNQIYKRNEAFFEILSLGLPE